MVEWTKEAIEAAESARERFLEDRAYEGDIYSAAMRAALIAASDYEGVFPTSFVEESQKDAYMRGRAEAFEEGAKILWDRTDDDQSDITDKILKGLSGVFHNLAKEGK